METRRRWTFITHHAQVLLAIARDPEMRVREIAEAVQITERYAYRVLNDLQEAGFVGRSRHGRGNRYRINPERTLGDPVVGDQSLREFLRLINPVEHADMLDELGPRLRTN
jgi:DNA-binding IclR family transcriptional regulator